MTYIVPFEAEFVGKVRKVYAVNEDNPQKSLGGNITTHERCPHCQKGHIFRVYNPKADYTDEEYAVEVYDCKCPSCWEEFDLKIEHEM